MLSCLGCACIQVRISATHSCFAALRCWHLLAATCSYLLAAVRLSVHNMLPAALATEDPTPELLEVPPNGKHDWIINGCMLKHIFCQVGFGLHSCHHRQARWCQGMWSSPPCDQATPARTT